MVKQATYLIKPTKKTADSRLWLFFILTLNVGLEHLVIWWCLPVEGENAIMDLSQIVSERIWMVWNMAFFRVVVLTDIFVLPFSLCPLHSALLLAIKHKHFPLIGQIKCVYSQLILQLAVRSIVWRSTIRGKYFAESRRFGAGLVSLK